MSGLLYVIWINLSCRSNLDTYHCSLPLTRYQLINRMILQRVCHYFKCGLILFFFVTTITARDFFGVWTCLSSSTHDSKFSYPYWIFKVWDLSFLLVNPVSSQHFSDILRRSFYRVSSSSWFDNQLSHPPAFECDPAFSESVFPFGRVQPRITRPYDN